MSNLAKTANYIKNLDSKPYNISSMVSGLINYFVDTYFYKVDERNKKAPQKWYPSDPVNHIKEIWLESSLYKCTSVNRTYPSWSRALNSYSFYCLFNGPSSSYDIIPFMDSYEFSDMIKNDYNFRVQSELFEISLSQKMLLPAFGCFFVKCRKTNQNLIVNLDLCYTSMSCSVSVMTNPENSQLAEKFLVDLDESRMVNDIYYKKCLTYDQGVFGFGEVTNTSWDSIIMKPSLKEMIRNNTVEILKNADKFLELGMPPSNNVMLISPPGMAKTMTFRAIDCEVSEGMTRIWCTGKSINQADHVTALFDAARALTPCIIFIEDMDLFGQDRSSFGGSGRILNEFLACLDGAKENSGVVVMASTNDVFSMDEALINRPGRFDSKIEIPLPDADDRREMISKFFKSYCTQHDDSFTADSFSNVIELTEGLTGDYIKSLVKNTIKNAVAEGRVVKGICYFSLDNIIKATKQIIDNHKIGQMSKKHHKYQSPPDGFLLESNQSSFV